MRPRAAAEAGFPVVVCEARAPAKTMKLTSLTGRSGPWLRAPTSVIVADHRGTAEWIATGTDKGDMQGMPASNKVIKVPGVPVFECSDRKIIHVVEYWDMATLKRQLGFLAAPTK
jgi:steroid delta-isomerase-like uncharacterized protein